MEQSKVKKALIIAAGMGVRFGEKTNHKPKPLISVAGVPLILRTIYTAHKAGVDEFVIVTGYQREQIEEFLKDKVKLPITIRFVYNENWQRPNGWSVYSARDEFSKGERFFLMMADHIFESSILEVLQKKPLQEGRCRLAVDFNPSRVFDLEEATKVLTDEEGFIKRIGKNIAPFNGVDTGFFLCTTSIFTALEASLKEEKETLSEGIQKLADKNLMEVADIGSAFWQDVDNEKDLKLAEDYLFNSLTSKTDSWLTRKINRKISISITRRLVNLPVNPNQITLFNFSLGIIASIVLSKGSYFALILGTFLFLLSSILDGCDGELARITFRQTRLGAWLDVTTDNIVHWFLFTALTVTSVKTHGIFPYAFLGISLLLSSFISFVLTWFMGEKGLLFSESTLSDVTYQKRAKIVDKMANRDFAYLLFALALVNHTEWFLFLGGLGSPVFTWFLYKSLTEKRNVSNHVYS